MAAQRLAQCTRQRKHSSVLLCKASPTSHHPGVKRTALRSTQRSAAAWHAQQHSMHSSSEPQHAPAHPAVHPTASAPRSPKPAAKVAAKRLVAAHSAAGHQSCSNCRPAAGLQCLKEVRCRLHEPAELRLQQPIALHCCRSCQQCSADPRLLGVQLPAAAPRANAAAWYRHRRAALPAQQR